MESVPVLTKPLSPPEGAPGYSFRPSSQVLPAGHRKTPACRAFPVATVFDRDVAIPLRDGVQLRADIFRPADSDRRPVPALFAWSPYGKSGAGVFGLDMFPNRVGVPAAALSGYEKFEAPDPAEFVARGYAVVNIDSRGAYDSEGDLRFWGTGEGEDGHDACEHVASLPWCSGDVAFTGNSWLAVAQWFVAAQRPAHLRCIAPFEGLGDVYRENVRRGGVPNTAFSRAVGALLFGRNQQEDVAAMAEKYPLWNAYWEDHRAQMDRIEVPAYILGSWSTCLHTIGSLRAFQEIPHQKKWLRVHATQEWHDLYSERTTKELGDFLDCYCKGVDNGWEQTPQIRVSLLGFNQPTIENKVFTAWPPAEATSTTLMLSPTGKLSTSALDAPGELTYLSSAPFEQNDSDRDELRFAHTFTSPTHLVGPSKAVLYITAASSDTDVYVQLRKVSATGTVLQYHNIPLPALNLTAEQVPDINPLKYLGPTGVLRASHRKVDEKLSTGNWVVQEHRAEEKLVPGEVYKLEIGIWPTGMVFAAGEALMLKVSGHEMILPEFPQLRGASAKERQNDGDVTVHMGGDKASHLIVPLMEVTA